MDQKVLQSVFSYNPETGELIYKITGSSICNKDDRYFKLYLFGKHLWAHRVIFMLVYGYLPKHVDHINGNGFDNRLCNLRGADASRNQANNYKLQRGVEKRGNRFRARIKVKGERISLGSYATEQEAQDAYDEAAVKYFGEYARCVRAA